MSISSANQRPRLFRPPAEAPAASPDGSTIAVPGEIATKPEDDPHEVTPEPAVRESVSSRREKMLAARSERATRAQAELAKVSARTPAAATPAEPKPVPQQLPSHIYLPIELLIPASFNPRFIHNQTADDELAANVRAIGIQQPLLARPHPKKHNHYEVIAGSRRLKAAIAAGLKEAPVIVREMDDRTARELNVVENLHRLNLHPLEKAKGIHELLELGWPIDRMAAELGMTGREVKRGAQLWNLSPNWQKAIQKAGSPLALWEEGCLQAIAALSQPVQDLVLADMHNFRWDYSCGRPTRLKLERWLAETFTFALAAAPWPKDDPTLNPAQGRCSDCAERTGANPLLWSPDEASQNITSEDRCLLPSCYHKKSARYIEVQMSALRQEHRQVLVTDGEAGLDHRRREEIQKRYGKDFKSEWEIAPAGKKQKGAIPVMDVAGPLAGRVRWVKPEPASQDRSKRAADPGKPVPLKERLDMLYRRRRAYCIEEVRRQVESMMDAKGDPPGQRVASAAAEAIAALLTFGTMERASSPDGGRDGSWKRLKKWLAADVDSLKRQAYREVLRVMAARLTVMPPQNSGHFNVLWEDAKQIAAFCAINLSDLEKEAEEQIRKPKSWEALNADGTPKTSERRSAGKKAVAHG